MGVFPRIVHAAPDTPDTRPRPSVLPEQRPGDAKKLKDWVESIAARDKRTDLFAVFLASFQGADRRKMGLNLPEVRDILRLFGFFNANDDGDESRAKLVVLLSRIISQRDPIMQQWIREEEIEATVRAGCPSWYP